MNFVYNGYHRSAPVRNEIARISRLVSADRRSQPEEEEEKEEINRISRSREILTEIKRRDGNFS